MNDLLQFTSHQTPSWQTFELDALVLEVCESLAPQFHAQGIDTDLDIPAHLTVTADRDMIRRATLNLILNALDAMPEGGELAVTGLCSCGGVELEIADSGPGILDDAEQALVRTVLHHQEWRHRPGTDHRRAHRRRPRRRRRRQQLSAGRRRVHHSTARTTSGRLPHDRSTRLLFAAYRPRAGGRRPASARESMADVLRHAGHQVRCCSSAVEALQLLTDWSADVIVTDLKMPGMNGLEFIRALAQRPHDAQIVMVTAHATVASAVDAMRHGAFDYIEKPFRRRPTGRTGPRACGTAKRSCARTARTSVGDAAAAGPQAGHDRHQPGHAGAAAARSSRSLRTDETVLITGEEWHRQGAGRAATSIAASKRAGAPLVSFNCPALSPQLVESELFGHERGAFTGADAPRVGRFELADRGTVLLDEITEIDLPLQAKLLRVLQEQTFERVGSSITRSVDVRVLATTNRDLHAGSPGRPISPGSLLPPGRGAASTCRRCASAARTSRTWSTTSCNAPPQRLEQAPPPVDHSCPRPAGQPLLARQRARTGEHHHSSHRAVQ